jgi:hypothetical protein
LSVERCPGQPDRARNIDAPLLGPLQNHRPTADEVFICDFEVPSARRMCCERMLSRGARFTQIIHRTAVLGHNVNLADGVVL